MGIFDPEQPPSAKLGSKILFTDSIFSTYQKPPLMLPSLKILVLIYISSERYSFWLLNHFLHLEIHWLVIEIDLVTELMLTTVLLHASR